MKVPFLFLGVATIALFVSLAGTYGLIRLAMSSPTAAMVQHGPCQIMLPNGQGDFMATSATVTGSSVTFHRDNGQLMTVSGNFIIFGGK
jgi:hypothetical protein